MWRLWIFPKNSQAKTATNLWAGSPLPLPILCHTHKAEFLNSAARWLAPGPGGGAWRGADLILSVRNIIQPATDTRLGRCAAADTARPWVLTIRGHCLALSITASRPELWLGLGMVQVERGGRRGIVATKLLQYSDKLLEKCFIRRLGISAV